MVSAEQQQHRNPLGKLGEELSSWEVKGVRGLRAERKEPPYPRYHKASS
jgi:hypothetical protein